ncbi:uncharacterized protein BDV14DRAFT_141910 [Aspergillus stella-maris]|uniref:uncharacterized protein n=1 Tax=Aspergillus stella-maris TaxID=1810926 RepID=UPI003CCD9495
MRFMLGVLKVFVVFLTVALASPNVHATNDRTLTPVIKTEPRTGGVQVTPRDLFTRQSCETGYEECHDHCCSTFDTCCENSCTPLGGECCSDGLSCDSGEACCGDKCMPSLASCCGGGGEHYLAIRANILRLMMAHRGLLHPIHGKLH